MTIAPAMPRSEMHEKLVLSTIINNPEAFWESPNLCADHFHSNMREWFAIVRKEIETGSRFPGEPLDIHALIFAASNTGRMDALGGPSTLADLYTYNVSGSAIAQNVAILSEFRARRLAVIAANRIIEAATTEDADSLSDAIAAPITAISDAMTDSAPPLTTKDIMKECFDRFTRRASGQESSTGIATLPLLDYHLHGAHPGRLWVIGAYPEGGKSVLASQIILDAATDGTPCLFLSLEMPERDVMDRMIVQQARIEARAFTEPKAYARENGGEEVATGLMKAIQGTIPVIGHAPLRVQRPANRNLQTILAAIRKAHRETGIKIAVVDYVQLIKGGKHDNKEAEVSEISHALQELAQDLQITLIVLSQLNQDGDTKHGRVIEEDADAVLSIIQDRNKDSETYKQHRYILISKDRHYGSGGTRVPLILDRARIRFIEGQDETNAKKGAKKQRFQP
jgi:replicative DNA helicase